MEFRFNLNEIFGDSVVEVDSTLIPPGFKGDKRALWDTQAKISQIVNAMGEASAHAQGLNKPITTAERLRNSEHKLYLLLDKEANNGKGAVTGMLKIGEKGLYVFDRQGQHYKVSPCCVLDFYVHESRQRSGFGKKLFEHMLELEKTEPVKLAIDRPSDKFLGFLKKHYQLDAPIKQMNNYVVFDEFFSKSQEDSARSNQRSSKEAEPDPSTPGKRSSANGLQPFQGSPYGRYGAPRPTCSMGQIIHNDTAVVINQEPTGIQSTLECGQQGFSSPQVSQPQAISNNQIVPLSHVPPSQNIPQNLPYQTNNHDHQTQVQQESVKLEQKPVLPPGNLAVVNCECQEHFSSQCLGAIQPYIKNTQLNQHQNQGNFINSQSHNKGDFSHSQSENNQINKIQNQNEKTNQDCFINSQPQPYQLHSQSENTQINKIQTQNEISCQPQNQVYLTNSQPQSYQLAQLQSQGNFIPQQIQNQYQHQTTYQGNQQISKNRADCQISCQCQNQNQVQNQSIEITSPQTQPQGKMIVPEYRNSQPCYKATTDRPQTYFSPSQNNYQQRFAQPNPNYTPLYQSQPQYNMQELNEQNNKSQGHHTQQQLVEEHKDSSLPQNTAQIETSQHYVPQQPIQQTLNQRQVIQNQPQAVHSAPTNQHYVPHQRIEQTLNQTHIFQNQPQAVCSVPNQGYFTQYVPAAHQPINQSYANESHFTSNIPHISQSQRQGNQNMQNQILNQQIYNTEKQIVQGNETKMPLEENHGDQNAESNENSDDKPNEYFSSKSNSGSTNVPELLNENVQGHQNHIISNLQNMQSPANQCRNQGGAYDPQRCVQSYQRDAQNYIINNEIYDQNHTEHPQMAPEVQLQQGVYYRPVQHTVHQQIPLEPLQGQYVPVQPQKVSRNQRNVSPIAQNAGDAPHAYPNVSLNGMQSITQIPKTHEHSKSVPNVPNSTADAYQNDLRCASVFPIQKSGQYAGHGGQKSILSMPTNGHHSRASRVTSGLDVNQKTKIATKLMKLNEYQPTVNQNRNGIKEFDISKGYPPQAPQVARRKQSVILRS